MAAMPRQQYDARSDDAAMARMFGGASPHHVVLGVVPNDNAMDVANGVPIGTVATWLSRGRRSLARFSKRGAAW